MQKTWLQEGLRNRFFKLPKPRHLRETHFCEDDPLLGVTKAMLLQQVAAGKYVLSELPPLISLPWFGVPKPNLTVRPIIDARYVNKYMISPKFSLPPMPKLVRNVLSCYKFARKYDITNGFDHLPRHKDSQTYFGIKIDGKLYTSTCILMDETCAPWAFQIWLHDMYKSFLREEGLSFTPIRSNTLVTVSSCSPPALKLTSSTTAGPSGATGKASCSTSGNPPHLPSRLLTTSVSR